MLGGTVPGHMNPSRRRRRRRRTGRAHARRRVHRRYGKRRYRKNPGGMLIDLAKQVVPVALGYIGANIVINRVGPMIPGVAALGSLQQPLLAVATTYLAHIGTKKVAVLAKHKNEIMLGAGLAMVKSLFQAFAPASVQSMVGMSDYVSMSDYVAVGGAPPLREDFTLSDYVAVGGDGLEEELGLTEELGVEEALGDARLGGLPGPTNGGLMKTVPTMAFMQPVPARSFTKPVPAAGGSYDNSNQVYTGIFGGGFGH